MTVVTIAVIIFDYIIYQITSNLFLNRLGYSVVGAITVISMAVLCITAGLYIYYVYIINLGNGSKKNDKKDDKKKISSAKNHKKKI
jgi:hypothetical protein